MYFFQHVSMEQLLEWADEAADAMNALLPQIFENANSIDESGGFRDAVGMCFESQARFQIQCMVEALSDVPDEKWDEFMQGHFPKSDVLVRNGVKRQRLTLGFLKKNAGYDASLKGDKDMFWVNSMIDEFIAEETDFLDDEKNAGELRTALCEAFHETTKAYLALVSSYASR